MSLGAQSCKAVSGPGCAISATEIEKKLGSKTSLRPGLDLGVEEPEVGSRVVGTTLKSLVVNVTAAFHWL